MDNPDPLTCIVDNTDRGSVVVDRIGSLIKKAPPRKEVVDLNAVVLEVTTLTRSEAVKTGVTVGTQLTGDLPSIQCDRVQLQQVMLNSSSRRTARTDSLSARRLRASAPPTLPVIPVIAYMMVLQKVDIDLAGSGEPGIEAALERALSS